MITLWCSGDPDLFGSDPVDVGEHAGACSNSLSTTAYDLPVRANRSARCAAVGCWAASAPTAPRSHGGPPSAADPAAVPFWAQALLFQQLDDEGAPAFAGAPSSFQAKASSRKVSRMSVRGWRSRV